MEYLVIIVFHKTCIFIRTLISVLIVLLAAPHVFRILIAQSARLAILLMDLVFVSIALLIAIIAFL